MFVVTFYEIKE